MRATRTLTAKYGVPKFTLMPILLKATSLALSEFPILNSSIAADGTSYTMHGTHNIGLAMDTPNGLLVPNVKDVRCHRRPRLLRRPCLALTWLESARVD